MAEWISENRYLNDDEMRNNAIIQAQYMVRWKWTTNAIAAILGNEQTESSINPGIWYNLQPHSASYGLVQWDPYTKLQDWAESRGLDWTNGFVQCDRIKYEMENGLQWIETNEYPMSFAEFVKSHASPEYLAQVWLYNYERPADLNQPNRSEQARRWFEEIKGLAFPVWLLFKFKKRRLYW